MSDPSARVVILGAGHAGGTAAALPEDASASDLHQRHVDTEQQEHERRTGLDRRRDDAATRQPVRQDGAE